MFLGRNRFTGGSMNEAEGGAADPSAMFLNQAGRPIPNGMQRFLNKKGINSQEDLFNRLQYAPRVSFRRAR